ncbi:MAG: hypothetical protein H3C51_05905 [Rubellimicrobium sp.]|nr:hypothetical protein [Rubellimicrobium sp.]
MSARVLFDPLTGWPVIAALAALVVLVTALALVRGLPGWWLRALAGLAVLAALANPSLHEETREPLADIVIAVVDESASQTLGDRSAQADAALAALRSQAGARGHTELRVVRVGDAPDNGGTQLLSALAEALAGEPRGRVAGIVLITDGRAHDIDRTPPLPAPTHVLLTGSAGDWDRRLVVENAPAFAIMGEEVTLGIRIDDEGAAPGDETAQLTISVDGGPPVPFEIQVGRQMQLPFTVPHAGANVLEIATPRATGELTAANNRAVVQMNGVRDRMRVLLVSGEPNPGERTWRNLLRSDPSVDLVHFTILRPPEKQDGVPVDELSLIAFPTRELFVDKIEDFDLIIFDRYRSQGILPPDYLFNIAEFVRRGGAVLVAGGPEYADATSLWRTPLGEVLPATPTAQVLEAPFVPILTDTGRRHPVTEGLDALAPARDDGSPGWGSWLRLVEVTPEPGADVLMEGPGGRPLLVLDRVGEGRAALVASDQMWLWDRGYDGGGPQMELLRRLAHWLMQEPELEEDTLRAEAVGRTIRIIRHTLHDEAPEVTILGPDGHEVTVPLAETAPGQFETLWQAGDEGLFRLESGAREAVIVLGPAAPREYEQTIATPDLLAPLISPTGGGVFALSDGMPRIAEVRAGRPAAGDGWMGIVPRGAERVTATRVAMLLPAWLWLLLAAGLALGAWLAEGRRAATGKGRA